MLRPGIALLLFIVGLVSQESRPGRILFATFDGLFLTDPHGTQIRPLAKNVRVAALSPDGTLVAYADEKRLQVISIETQAVSTLVEIPDGTIESVSWSPTQKLIAYDQHGKTPGLFVIPYPRANASPRSLGEWYESISFSPDGKSIIHPANVPGTTNHGLQRVDVASGKREILYEAPSLQSIFEARYSPDGSSIAFTMSLSPPKTSSDDDPDCCGGPELHLWLLTLGMKSPVELSLKRVAGDWTNVKDFSWSADSKSLVIGIGTVDCDYPGEANGVFLTTLDQKTQLKLSPGRQSLRGIFSPDGKNIVFTEYTDEGVQPRLTIVDLASKKLTPIARTRSESTPTAVDWK